MINKEGKFEKEAERILSAYAKELQKSRNAYLDALEQEEVPNPTLFVEEPYPKVSVQGHRKIRLKRVLVLVAVLVLLMGLAVVSSEGARKQFFGFLQNDKEGHTELKFVGDEENASGLPDFELGYVPEGFELYDATDDGVCKEIAYLGEEKGERICCSIQKSSVYSAGFDTETHERKEVMVNTSQGLLFYGESDCMLVWQVGDYTFDLLTSFSEKETLEVARSITLKR
ncbi:DUF4367 domain-containing protein [Anaerotruncus sp. 80]|uniref:DUF4367 domain-containing protein n=1 Tax=Anaerotruncus colihominis TaxID=169435 RepID=A0A845QHU6_9FIRM|nr:MULTISPECIES: DUF4367 domain-containing protein [Anaerotruncus]NBH61712.1 DUF4367 domain-containing protein [Anaerotruncus colihominis]NCF02367.1 DUF4367 domain-containing protein [Anaerotruncus sp. 80]